MSRSLICLLPSKTNVKDCYCPSYDCGSQHFNQGRYLEIRKTLTGIMPPTSETKTAYFMNHVMNSRLRKMMLHNQHSREQMSSSFHPQQYEELILYSDLGFVMQSNHHRMSPSAGRHLGGQRPWTPVFYPRERHGSRFQGTQMTNQLLKIDEGKGVDGPVIKVRVTHTCLSILNMLLNFLLAFRYAWKSVLQDISPFIRPGSDLQVTFTFR